MIDVNGVTRNLVAGAGKDKHIYIADRNNLGKFVPSSNATLYQDVKGVSQAAFSLSRLTSMVTCITGRLMIA